MNYVYTMSINLILTYYTKYTVKLQLTLNCQRPPNYTKNLFKIFTIHTVKYLKNLTTKILIIRH